MRKSPIKKYFCNIEELDLKILVEATSRAEVRKVVYEYATKKLGIKPNQLTEEAHIFLINEELPKPHIPPRYIEPLIRAARKLAKIAEIWTVYAATLQKQHKHTTAVKAASPEQDIEKIQKLKKLVRLYK